MGRVAKELAEKSVRKKAKSEGMHAVGGVPGLYLNVAGESRSWVFRYTLNGRRRDHGLGSYADFTLEQARSNAREKRDLVLAGIDPVDTARAEKDADRAATAKRMTFEQCVAGYLDAHGDGWKNAKHRAQWASSLSTYAGPIIGKLNVADIETAHVLKILNPIWKEKTETASRVRGRIENVLSWATAHRFRAGENPARWKGHLDQMLAKPSRVAKVEHHAALPYKQMGAFMTDLRKLAGISVAALEFAILTAARSGEVRGAKWSEIDLDSGVWRIPGDRMKAGKEHMVALSDDALAVIKRMQQHQLSDFVFPGVKENSPLSDMSLTAVLRRMKRGDLTAHGFRSSFRDWVAEETSYPHEMAEMALAHAIASKVEAAYRRGNMLAKRRQMMQDWAAYCRATENRPQHQPGDCNGD